MLDVRPHRRELAPDLVRRVAGPVHLRVVVVAIGLRRPRQKQVVLQPVVGPGVVRRRVGRLNRLRDLADPAGRNRVVGELLPARAVRIARRRVIQPEVREHAVDFAEVARPHPLRRHRVDVEAAGPLVVALIRPEEEQPVLPQRAAHRAAANRDARVELGRVEEVPRVELVLIAEVERRPLDLVGPRLGHQRDRRAARHPLAGVEVVGADVHRVDGLGRRHIPGVVRQPDVDAARPIQPRVVAVRVGPVDERPQRPRRRVRLVVLKRRRRRPRHQVDQRLVVAVLVQRQAGDFLRLQLRVHVRLVGLQQLHRRGHRHRLGQRAHFQRHFHPAHRARRHRHPGLDELPEALQRHLHVVGSRQHVRQVVAAVVAGHRVAGQPRRRIGRRHRRAGDARPLRVLHDTDHAAVKDLRPRARRTGAKTGDDEGEDAGKPQARSPDPSRLAHCFVLLVGCEDEICSVVITSQTMTRSTGFPWY